MPSSPDALFEELRTSKLPSLPHVLVEMLRVCQDETASFAQISEIVSRDAPVTARVIAMANSSFYSRGSKINSIERALLVLGTETIKTIIITASVQQFFSSFNATHTLYLKHFWRQSLSCALLAKQFATLTSYPRPEEAYLTGLLHNIGELVLETNHTEDYDELLQNTADEQDRIELENELFLTNHCDVGCWLADSWQLSDFAADAIKYHHAALDAVTDAHHLVKLVYLAALLSGEHELSGKHEQISSRSLAAAEKLFDLDAAVTAEIFDQVRVEVIAIAQSLNIDIESDTETDEDKEKQVELAEHVRNVGLMQSAKQHLDKSATIDAFLSHLSESAELLFGFRNIQYLAFDDETSLLIHKPSQRREEEVPITVSPDNERSLVASAGKHYQITDTFEQTMFPNGLPVVDQQFVRISRCAGVVYLPLHHNNQLMGILVMGAPGSPMKQNGSRHLLSYFAMEASRIMHRLLEYPSEESRSEAVEMLRLKIRETIHEANNPLSIIRNYLETLSQKLGEDHEANKEIDIIKEEIDRTGNIIVRLRDLETEVEDNQPGTDLNEEITALVSLYRNSLFLTHAIECKTRLDAHLARQNLNRNILRQILTNLIKNAAEAMPNGGNIIVSTSANLNMNGRSYAEIRITDDGPGIPETVMKNIFKPVQSTKGNAHSGLGLSIVKNLIDDLGGLISCRSNQAGTEFQILLPQQDCA